MTTLNLVRVPIRTEALARWAGNRGWVNRRRGSITFDEGRALHHLLGESLGVGAIRPFRLLVAPRRSEGNIYGYSSFDTDALRSAAQDLALPDHLSVLHPDRLESKPMPESWRKGQRLGFDLRVRPIRRLRKNLETATKSMTKGSEVDAFLIEALARHPENKSGMEQGQRNREAVYLDWLAERLDPAAKLSRSGSRLARFRRNVVARGTTGIEGPDATIHGTLTIVDEQAFTDLLARGVGRHKAYGYGMLLLRSPHKAIPKS